jgi:uncharacterized protein (DUF111 family)
VLKFKEGTVWMVQADHLSGEALGVVLERLMALGATNVQILPTITKKNRPGHVIFIDVVDNGVIEPIEDYLVHELGISGHHRWKTEHHYAPTEVQTMTLQVQNGESALTMQVQVKTVGANGSSRYVRIEHDSAVEVQREITEKLGRMVSLREISSIMESALVQNRTEATIVLNGGGAKRYVKQEVRDGKA